MLQRRRERERQEGEKRNQPVQRSVQKNTTRMQPRECSACEKKEKSWDRTDERDLHANSALARQPGFLYAGRHHTAKRPLRICRRLLRTKGSSQRSVPMPAHCAQDQWPRLDPPPQHIDDEIFRSILACRETIPLT